jgi:hypothetical protein
MAPSPVSCGTVAGQRRPDGGRVGSAVARARPDRTSPPDLVEVDAERGERVRVDPRLAAADDLPRVRPR